MARTNILITGSAGLVGMHVLYELLGDLATGGPAGTIYPVLRPSRAGGARARLQALLDNPWMPERLRASADACGGRVRPLEADLRDGPALARAVRDAVPAGEPLTIIHCAGSVNLENSGAAAADVADHNVHGTRTLLDSVGGRLERFVHVSTAYCSGVGQGVVGDDYLGLSGRTYRNPYEESKARTEIELESRCRQRGVGLHIVRPSIVCGRVMDAPLYYTPKFDVFYGWLRFFWQMRKAGQHGPVRLAIPATSTMNVVPVDYVARAIARAAWHDVGQLNVVSPDPVPTRLVCGAGLACIGYDDVRFVDAPPADPTRLEEIYVGSVGRLFEAYIDEASTSFSAAGMRSFMAPVDFPTMLPHLSGIVSFAVDHEFDDRRITAARRAPPVVPVPVPQFDGPRAWEAT